MKVAFFVDVFPRLSNTFIINQITGLLTRGHEVDIFARAIGDFDHAHGDVGRYCLGERMRHIAVPRRRLHRLVKAARLVIGQRAWHAAVADALNVRRHGRDALSLVQLYTVLSFLAWREYDVVHCQFGKLAPLLLPLRESGVLSAKLVTSFRGADLTRQLPKEQEKYDRLFSVGDLFLPVSGTFARRLVDAGCDPDRVVVHHSGIVCDLFPFQERHLAHGEQARLLFIGRLTEKKGVGYAVEALSRLIAAGRDVVLTIIGDGEERERIELQVDRLGVRQCVRLIGYQDQKSVISHLRRSHLLIAPSVTAADGDQEGIPNVLKEAMAMGLAVVATRHSGIPELVEDGVSGYLVAERDSDALAGSISRLLDEPESWPAMGRAGRAKVEAEFDSGRLNDQLVDLYRGSEPRSRPRSESAAFVTADQ
jgi:colanic acid/amylovoran biosynthesis glycosyltransferase